MYSNRVALPEVSTPYASESDENFSDDSSNQSDEECQGFDEVQFSVSNDLTSNVLDPMIELDEF